MDAFFCAVQLRKRNRRNGMEAPRSRDRGSHTPGQLVSGISLSRPRSRPVPGTSAFLCTTVRPVPLDSPARGILRSASLQRPSWAEPAFAAAAGVGAGPGISSQYRAAAATAAPSPLLRRRHQGLLAAAAASAGSPGGPSPAATPLSSSSEPPAGSAAGSDVVATNGNGANGAHTANGAHAPSLAAAGADGGSAAATAHAPAWEQKARAAAAAMMASGVDGEDDGAGAAPAAAPPPAKTRIQNAIDMATFALPLATQNVLGYSLNALSESLAYGAGNRRLMRLVLLRAVVVCWAVCVPVVALWSNAEPFLLMLGQNPTLVAASTEYLKALAPSMFAYVLAECVQTYLVVQGIVAPTTIAKAVLDLGLVGAGYAYALCKATNAMLLLGWLGWRILRGPEQQQQQQHLASKEVAVAEGEEGAEGGAAGAAAALGKADASGGGPLKLADLRLVEAQKARAEQKKREQQQRLLEGRQGESSEGRRQKRGEHGMDGNAHEEILTPPLAAAASAPEFNLGHEGAMAAAKVESSGDASRRGTGTALAAAAAGTGTAAVAAAAMPTAWGGLLHGRGAEMWAAVKAEMVEVFDLRACWEYVKFGFPAAVMSCLEWWAYEALVIMAGWLPNAEVALGCLGICLTVSGWVYMVPQAISTAACTRVSNALGAGDAVTAKRNFQAAYGLVLVSQLAISACLLPNAARVARFFCPDPVAAALASTLLPITALNTIGDGMNCVLNGILRACGRQALGARLQLMTYWVCGLPLAYWAAFKMGLGVKGFVMAIGATSLAQSLLVGLLISRFNWDVEVRNSQQLLSTISSSGSSGSSGSADDASGADEGAVGEQGAAAGGRR
eukprot:XP_001693328.1 MATE efflux family protein [Chlamydomonas reinhardtii]